MFWFTGWFLRVWSFKKWTKKTLWTIRQRSNWPKSASDIRLFENGLLIKIKWLGMGESPGENCQGSVGGGGDSGSLPSVSPERLPWLTRCSCPAMWSVILHWTNSWPALCQRWSRVCPVCEDGWEMTRWMSRPFQCAGWGRALEYSQSAFYLFSHKLIKRGLKRWYSWMNKWMNEWMNEWIKK